MPKNQIYEAAPHARIQFPREIGGTQPDGRPQPGAGDAGDGDKPRKSPTGPLSGEQKAKRARGITQARGKRAAAKKPSTASGRQAERRASDRSGSARSTSKKLTRKKKNDAGRSKRRMN